MSERLPVLFWYGTRAEYAAISAKQSNTLYFIAGENKLYRGEEAFATDFERLIAVAASAPVTAEVGEQYYNSTEKKIFACVGNANSTPQWGKAVTPSAYLIYFDINAQVIYAWNGSDLIAMCSGDSAEIAKQAAEEAKQAAEEAKEAVSEIKAQIITVDINPEEIDDSGIWSKTFNELGVTSPRIVQLLNSEGQLCTEDPLIIIKWGADNLTVDFGVNIPVENWKALIL